jgi:hypothetical protein
LAKRLDLAGVTTNARATVEERPFRAAKKREERTRALAPAGVPHFSPLLREVGTFGRSTLKVSEGAESCRIGPERPYHRGRAALQGREKA